MIEPQGMLELAEELHEFCAAAPHNYPGHNIRLFERAEAALRQAAQGREAICEICHKPLEIGDDYIFTKRLMHRRCALAAQEPGEDKR